MKFVNTQIGDEVAIITTRPFLIKKLKVEKVTETQITVAGKRYTRNRGNQVGGGWYAPYAEPWTANHEKMLADEKERRVKEAKVTKLGAIEWRKLTDQQLADAEIALTELGILK